MNIKKDISTFSFFSVNILVATIIYYMYATNNKTSEY